jgi:phosphomethylpyrimidine synthase
MFEACAHNESLPLDQLMDGIARGELVITKNKNHHFDKIVAIGKGTSTKINANIGSSKDMPELQSELQKLCVAVKAGADTVMDLSMGGDLDAVRRGILEQCPVPLGTVPIYILMQCAEVSLNNVLCRSEPSQSTRQWLKLLSNRRKQSLMSRLIIFSRQLQSRQKTEWIL